MIIGTVGTNFIVDSFIDAARKAKAEVAAVYSRSADTGRAFASKHGVAKVHTDRAAFLSDPAYDFIYIASPNSLHFEWCRDALNAGKNVICEKPFVSYAAELEELVALAKKKRLFLFEALTTPHLPNFRLICEKLPLIGKIRFLQLNFSQYSSRYMAFLEGKAPNNFSPDFSGGTLMDINYYNLCFVERIFGEPDSVRYIANKAANGIDTSGVLIMKYGDMIASCVAAKDSDSVNSVQIQGELGYIIGWPTSSNLRDGFSVVRKNGEERHNLQKEANVLYYEMLDFVAEYERGNPACCEIALEHALVCARLMDSARADAGIVFAADGNK